jgi:imidazolonepropionase-like amidohydrolase
MRRRWVPAVVLCGAALALPAPAQDAGGGGDAKQAKPAKPAVVRPLAIAVKQLITGPDATQPGAIVLIESGAVAKTGRVAVPKEAVKVSLVNSWAMPGLVDAVTRAGAGGDLWEPAAAFTPEMRAADALDPWSPQVRALGRAGVTTFGLVPDPRNVAGGFAGACRALAAGSEAAPAAEVAVPESVAVFSLTDDAMRSSRFPGSRLGALPALRRALTAGRDAGAPMLEVAEAGRDAAQVRAAFGRVVAGGRGLIHATTSDEIDAALALREWFPKGLAICFPAEAHRRVRELGAAEAWVVLPPPLPGARQRELELPGKLHAAGATVVFASNTPSGRPDRLLLGAALAHAAGLPRDAAIRSAGRIAAGRRADLCFFSGDPLSGSAQLIGVLAGGRWLRKPPGVK